MLERRPEHVLQPLGFDGMPPLALAPRGGKRKESTSFLKKRSKKLFSCCRESSEKCSAENKSFLVLFFKKEHSSCLPVPLPCQRGLGPTAPAGPGQSPGLPMNRHPAAAGLGA